MKLLLGMSCRHGGSKMNNCDLCGKERFTEFTVKSKHLRWVLNEDLQKLDTHRNNWLTKNVCEDCFKKIFDKLEENHTIEQNTGENRVEGGVLSVSGSVSKTHYCYECTRFQFCHIASGETHKKACQKINLKREFEEKHYRPFKSCDELIEFYTHKHYISENLRTGAMPVIWVTNKQTGCRELIMGYGVSAIKLVSATLDMNELFEKFTFLDGSVCGVEE